jgi:hypothetical protein
MNRQVRQNLLTKAVPQRRCFFLNHDAKKTAKLSPQQAAEGHRCISPDVRILSTQRTAKLKNGVFWDVTPCGSCKDLQEPHGVTFQKTPFFIVTVVKTSNLKQKSYPRNRSWRPMPVFPVSYEHHLYIKV